MAQKKSGIGGKEEPLDLDNHTMDALRYMVMQIDGGSRWRPV